jgi:ubiquinone/menaquinone biosynthesis C-methylase UbiE
MARAQEETSMPAQNPAETYESYMVPTLFAPWARRLVENAKLRAGERVLDVGCGTGVVARQVAPLLGPKGKVVGVDLNPNMLAIARTVTEREGLAISFREGRAEKLADADGSFDLVVCQFAIMFFADRAAALAEMHRVLVSGGRLVLSVWQGLDRHPFYQALHHAIRIRLGMSGVEDIFALGDASTLRALMTEAGFHKVALEPISMTARFPDPEGFLAGEIDVDTAAIPSMQHLDQRARQEMTSAIREDMAAPLRELTQGEEVVIPFHATIASAVR